MEKMVLKILLMCALGLNHWTCTGKELNDRAPCTKPVELSWLVCLLSLCPRVLACPGFPVYSYNQSSVKEALSASVAKVNAQSLSPYLFRAFRSSIKRVSTHTLFSTPL